jgi:hypothetical protein
MKKLKSRLLVLTLTLILLLLTMPIAVYAANENVEMIKQSDGNYLIYIKNNLKTDFEFAFSNDASADKTGLTYIAAGKDSLDADANSVAYVNSTILPTFSAPTYMWARITATENYIVEKVQIDLSKAVEENELQFATQITRLIPVDTKEIEVTTQTVDGKTIIKKVGKVKILGGNANYSYQLIRLPATSEYTSFIDLAEKISKFDASTNIYTIIETNRTFLGLYHSLKPSVSDSKWTAVSNNQILQPEDTENNERYVLWIKSDTTTDVQFMTSYKEYTEEKVKETITTRLPVTYDNNILLVVFGTLSVAIIVTYIAIKTLQKKQKQ